MSQVTFIQKLIRSLIKSLGFKRKLAAAFQTLALVIGTIPQLAPFATILYQVAAFLGITGIAHASVAAGVSGTPAVIGLPTVAAFFIALSQVADRVLVLAPYAPLFLFIANLLSALTAAVGTLSLITSIEAKE